MTNFYMFVDRSVCIHQDVNSYALRRYQTIELSEYYWYVGSDVGSKFLPHVQQRTGSLNQQFFIR